MTSTGNPSSPTPAGAREIAATVLVAADRNEER